jgi:phosphoglycerate-specific signal transduction histidine kinase
MYDFSQQAKSQWKENQLIYWARSIISLEKNDYISNRKKIFQDITKLESYIWKKIISEELIYQINWLHKKLKNNSFFQEMIWRILTILTLWIYWLVR